MRFDENNAECLVFTFKEGMLSAIAHDLKLRVGRFTIDAEADASGEGGQLTATFDPASLQVVCSMKDGAERHDQISDGDKRKITQSISDEVLHPTRFNQVKFVSSKVTGERVEGKLTLHGVERPLTVNSRREGERHVAEIDLTVTDFGIKPFTAALGTLRVKPTVRVRISIPRVR